MSIVNHTSTIVFRRSKKQPSQANQDYCFASSKVIQPGEYSARIAEVRESTTKNGSPSVDFCYELTPTKSSRQKSGQDELKLIKERFAYDGDRLENRLDEIERLGGQDLPADLDLSGLVGTKLLFQISFSGSNEFGQISVAKVVELSPGILTAADVKRKIIDDEDDEDDEDDDDLEEFIDDDD